MARKSLGYVHLDWTCPNCGTKNTGQEKVCTSCATPQPADVQFEQRAQEKIITDRKVIQQAKAGPDIHCAYCGTRNPATATQCSQCLADLREGAARKSGQTVGAYRPNAAADVACSHCGTMNPANAHRCSNCNANLAQPTRRQQRPIAKKQNKRIIALIGLAAVFILICCIGIFSVLFLRTEDKIGQVDGVTWKTTVQIEEFGPVQHEDWRDAIPRDGRILSCSEAYRYTSQNPEPNSEEVCGTPYTVDTGSGFGEVVQDCEYRVYDDQCTYEVNEWYNVGTEALTGNDFEPIYPRLRLSTNQREGRSDVKFDVSFRADGATYSYQPDSLNEFLQFQQDSTWILQVNTFDQVLSAAPKE